MATMRFLDAFVNVSAIEATSSTIVAVLWKGAVASRACARKTAFGVCTVSIRWTIVCSNRTLVNIGAVKAIAFVASCIARALVAKLFTDAWQRAYQAMQIGAASKRITLMGTHSALVNVYAVNSIPPEAWRAAALKGASNVDTGI